MIHQIFLKIVLTAAIICTSLAVHASDTTDSGIMNTEDVITKAPTAATIQCEPTFNDAVNGLRDAAKGCSIASQYAFNQMLAAQQYVSNTIVSSAQQVLPHPVFDGIGYACKTAWNNPCKMAIANILVLGNSVGELPFTDSWSTVTSSVAIVSTMGIGTIHDAFLASLEKSSYPHRVPLMTFLITGFAIQTMTFAVTEPSIQSVSAVLAAIFCAKTAYNMECVKEENIVRHRLGGLN